ncbi:MAG: ABC transporter permease subunit [Gammaproteobacteria bacterium]|nr:ABC transporter permease subunit [Gammaproteobacteria bacterium]
MIAAHLQPESLPEPEPGRSLWQDARRRIRQNPVAMASFSILVLVGIFALFGPIFSNWSSEDINWNVLGNVETAGRPALDSGHYFGTDQLGRDLFVRTAHGVRVSMMVGIIGALIAIVVGTLYGTIAGYVGGRTDNIMMRTVDVIMSIPYMFLLIILLVMFGQSILLLFVGIGLVSWLDMARIVRGQTLSIKNREFVESAVVIGVPPAFIILRHILPNLVGVVIVYATLLIPNMIIFESFISFLGLGIQEPNTSLGVLISEGASQMQYGVLWQLGFPLFFFILIQFGFFFLGDGIRDALDPKDRH